MGDDHWSIRRTFLFATSTFYALIIMFVLARGLDTELGRSAMTLAMFALAGNVGTYVFGATWEDLSMAAKGMPRQGTAFNPPVDPNAVVPPQ